MKKLFIAALILVVLMTSGCSSVFEALSVGGAGDWTYSLTGPYMIIRINSRTIKLNKKIDENTSQSVVSDFVLSFQYNERFVGLKALSDPEWEENAHRPTYEENDVSYYLFDMAQGESYGPFESASEYSEKCAEASAGEMCPWIETWPKPEGTDRG